MPYRPGDRCWLLSPGNARRVVVQRQVLRNIPAYRVRLINPGSDDNGLGRSMCVEGYYLSEEKPDDNRYMGHFFGGARAAPKPDHKTL